MDLTSLLIKHALQGIIRALDLTGYIYFIIKQL